MPVLELATTIAAPIERVFDLSRSIDLHVASTAHTGERAVAGITSGLIGMGGQVTWRARHFGVWQRLTSRITAYERPRHFRDSQVAGAFARFDHDHDFEPTGPGGTHTLMRDRFDFNSPLGPFGALADRFVLTRYLRALLVERNRVIREAAEGTRWTDYLPQQAEG